MKKFRLMLSFLTLVLAASFLLSCGASQGPGQLQSITVSPATADAEAQFTATGYYVHPSHTVTPQPATWAACYQGAPTTDVTVTTTGTAQCASGAAGTYTVFAFDIPPAQPVRSTLAGEDALSSVARSSPAPRQSAVESITAAAVIADEFCRGLHLANIACDCLLRRSSARPSLRPRCRADARSATSRTESSARRSVGVLAAHPA
jgi:hypothetical protein